MKLYLAGPMRRRLRTAMRSAAVGFCVGWACCHCYLSYRYHFRPWNSIPWGGVL